MKTHIISLLLTLAFIPACGHKKSHHKDIIHAPDELIVQSPLTLAGDQPTGRDEGDFNRCLTGDPDTLANCRLPYVELGSGTRDEQIANILSNTLVSHDWQIARFKAFLQNARPELVSMLSCVKGVAISGDIRPSFYYPPSGGIYLDAGYFAATKDEQGTVSEAPDSRQQNFDQISLLFFTMDTIRQETQEESIRRELEGLLAHELTHACDFKNFDLKGQYLSSALPAAPKNAVYHMAQWLYFGEKSSKAAFETFTPAEIGKSFEDGPIVDIYGYGNQFENLAMVVEDHLTFEFSGNNRTDLLTNNPKEGESLRGFPIYWGMKNKFCQGDLFAQGRAVAQKVVPVEIAFEKTTADCPTQVFPAGTKVYEALGIAP